MITGINTFLRFVDENWTSIIVMVGLIIGIFQKVRAYIAMSNEQKVENAKIFLKECILKMITDAEVDFEEWDKAGSIKRSQVIQEIYLNYPILNKISDQNGIITWIDEEIDKSLNTLREIISINSESEETT